MHFTYSVSHAAHTSSTPEKKETEKRHALNARVYISAGKVA
jgi:hypothetical protein